jgi:hypothetical protein
MLPWISGMVVMKVEVGVGRVGVVDVRESGCK